VMFAPFTAAPPAWQLGPGSTFAGDSLAVDVRGSSWAGNYSAMHASERFVLIGALGARGTTSPTLVSLLNDQNGGIKKYYCQLIDNSGMVSVVLTYTIDGSTFTDV